MRVGCKGGRSVQKKERAQRRKALHDEYNVLLEDQVKVDRAQKVLVESRIAKALLKQRLFSISKSRMLERKSRKEDA